ncbi:MAG: Htur_1727 family rSAM-partnered candidate RiPP [Halococcoides sp.]
MADSPDRHRVSDTPRSAVETEWELFVRQRSSEALTHVGSVSAPSVEVAYEQATTLFGWAATDIWVCPADAMTRFVTDTLEETAEPGPSRPSEGADP